jgi:transcriptional regulator GlxA family with amidase domain
MYALRDRFAEPVRIQELANLARMSPSAFHRTFKALTSMTPLQYQKRLRLLEARQLIVSTAVNVETAAFQVGYQSPSQFSREYARMFGAPPRRDVADLRVLAGRTPTPRPERSRKPSARVVQTGHTGGRVRLATGPM